MKIGAKELMMRYVYVNGDYPSVETFTKEFGYERSYYYRIKKQLETINYKEHCHDENSECPFNEAVSVLFGIK